MSKPWGGGIGSWAAEAEQAEAEERETGSGSTNPQSFPSLKEAVTTKLKKKQMTLSEFKTYGSSSSFSGSTRLTPDELLQLPTAPKPRSSDDGPRLGGGFASYGDDRGGPPPRRGFDDDRRGLPPRRDPDYETQPSRADEVDNWASAKRDIAPPVSDTGRTSRYGSLGGGGSRADEVDNWNLGKKQSGPPMPAARSSSFGSGFGNSGRFESSDRWRRGDSEVGRARLVLDPPSIGGGGSNGNKPNPFGVARPREEVLAEKGLDWKKLDLEIEAKKAAGSSSSGPNSSQGSRPTSSQSNWSENVGGFGGQVGPDVPVVKPRPKVNPFGDAKPREVLLKEKGMDWRKIDLELERKGIDRPETEEERTLKEEIENLRKELEKGSDNDDSEGEKTDLRDLIQSKERDLEAVITDLDNEVRFGQKAVERPGSGAGRLTTFPERPPSHSGSLEDRGTEYVDRPRSRGSDVWARPGEERRGGFRGGRDRGFLSNRDFDRSTSRERW